MEEKQKELSRIYQKKWRENNPKKYQIQRLGLYLTFLKKRQQKSLDTVNTDKYDKDILVDFKKKEYKKYEKRKKKQ